MTPSIAAAVIAAPGAGTDACVAALAAAGVADPVIVRVGEDGPAQARNRALAACAADVLAFVEDDVAVHAGWLKALAAAWEEGGPALGCAGGPLRAVFAAGERPGWLPDALLGTFATLDLGAEPLALTGAEQTFHSGNVSFHAAALRAIGGFWPARGHRDGRDWFSEEHEAQRDLARAGWTAAYVPGAAADRRVPGGVTRRAVLRRRLRYGARLAVLGDPRPPAVAARALATAALGTPLALARGQAAVAMERAARAAENAGVLLGEPLVHADLQPTAAATPFRPSVAPPQPRRPCKPTAGSGGATVLLYHRVASPPADPLGLCVSPANFAAQLDVLRSTREVTTLAAVAAGDAGPGAVAVTIDDGYADIAARAAPALAAAGVPAMLFVSTGHVADDLEFWWDVVERVLAAAPPGAAGQVELALAGWRCAFRVGTPEQRDATRGHLHRWLLPLAPEEIAAALAALGAWAGLPDEPHPPAGHRAMTIADVAAFAAHPGLDVGAHTRTHRSLRYAAPALQDEEIRGSRDDLRAWTGREPTAFSYPFGVPGTDLDAGTVARVREAGFGCAVVNAAGAVTAGTDRFALPRHAVPDLGGQDFAAWLAERAQ